MPIVEYKFSKMYYNWNWFTNAIQHIANELRDYGPQFIIGISRGGLVPTVALSHELKIPIGTISASSYYDSTTSKEVKVWGLILPLGVNINLAWRMKFVIVDDIYDSGKTQEAVKEYLLGLGFSSQNLKFVTMLQKEKDDKRWIVFPWEM